MRRGLAAVWALVGVGRRSELAATAAVGLVVAVAAAVLVAQPRLLHRAESDSLDQALEATPPEWLGLRLELSDLFAVPESADPTAAVSDDFDDLASELPPSLVEHYGAGRYLFDSTRFTVAEVDGEAAPAPITMTLRLHPDVGDRVEYVAGAAPGPVDEVGDDRHEVFEIALSTATAETLGLDVGSRLTLGVSDDALLRRIEGALPPVFEARVSGVFEPTGVDDPYWWGDLRLHRPVVNDTNAGAEYTAFGLFEEDQLAGAPFVVDGTTRMRVEQRRDLEPGSITVENSDGVVQTLLTTETPGDVGRLAVGTGLGSVLVNAGERRHTAQVTTLLATVGLMGATIATVVQFLRVSVTRRRSWLTLTRARGAGSTAVVLAACVEMGVVATLGAVVGSVVGGLIGGGDLMPTGNEVRLLALLVVGAVLATAVVVTGEARRFGTDATATTGRKWRRLGVGLVLIAGVASIAAYLREGIAPDDPWRNPLATLVPVLGPLAVAVAVGLVVPPLVARLTGLGLRLGVGRLLGLRRATGDGATVSGLGLVVTIALTVTGLGLAVDRGLTSGIEDAGWLAVGAPMRLETRDPEVVAAVGSLGSATVAPSGVSVVRVGAPDGETNVDLVNLDVPLYTLLTGETAADLRLPDLTGVDPVPVVAADRIDGRPIEVGDVLTGTGSMADITFEVVDTRPALFDRTEDWLLADRAVLAGLLDQPPPTSILYLDADEADTAALASIALEADTELVSRDELVARSGEDPLVRAVRWSYLGAGLVALGMVALATIGLVAVTTRARRRDAAVLGLVGGDRSELLGAARSELMVPVVSAAVAGTVLGVVLGGLLDGRLDLSPFTDGFPVTISPTVLLAVGCGLLATAVAAATVAVAVRRTVRAPIARLLRSEDT